MSFALCQLGRRFEPGTRGDHLSRVVQGFALARFDVLEIRLELGLFLLPVDAEFLHECLGG